MSVSSLLELRGLSQIIQQVTNTASETVTIHTDTGFHSSCVCVCARACVCVLACTCTAFHYVRSVGFCGQSWPTFPGTFGPLEDYSLQKGISLISDRCK